MKTEIIKLIVLGVSLIAWVYMFIEYTDIAVALLLIMWANNISDK